MEKSLFYPLDQEGLTTLQIQYDWKTGDVYLSASKDWDENLDWSRYNRDFYVESIKTHDARYLNEQEVWDLFEKYDTKDYLEEVIDLLRQGKHFGITCYWNKALDIKFMGNVHSRRRGINNGKHATLGGGIRRHSKDDPELEVIIDGLNLGRAMSYKNVGADLPMGGDKVTVIMDELDLNNMQQIGYLAFALDSMRQETGPDMGFPPAMTDAMIDNEYSYQYTCGPNGPLGSSGPPTAYGVFISLVEAAKFLGDDGTMDGWSFSVQGLGEVGAAYVKELAEKVPNVKIIVTDIDKKAVDACVSEWQAKGIDITSCDPDEILYQDVDVVGPFAMGGVIYEEMIPKLKCKMIWGSANNQIRASSVEEEIRVAKLLDEAGILFQADWYQNAGGIIFAWEEVCKQKAAKLDRVYEAISETLPRQTRDNLAEAKQLGITPTENAYRKANESLFGPLPFDK